MSRRLLSALILIVPLFMGQDYGSGIPILNVKRPSAAATFCDGSGATFCLDFEEAFDTSTCNAEGADTVNAQASCDNTTSPLSGDEDYIAATTSSAGDGSASWDEGSGYPSSTSDSTSTYVATMLFKTDAGGSTKGSETTVWQLDQTASAAAIFRIRALAATNWTIKVKSAQGTGEATCTASSSIAASTQYCIQINYDSCADDATIYIDQDADGDKSECGTGSDGTCTANGTNVNKVGEGVTMGHGRGNFANMQWDNVEITVDINGCT